MIESVIVLAYGPVGPTRAAIRRVGRSLPKSRIIVAAATPAGARAVRMLTAGPADTASGVGAESLRRAFEMTGTGTVLVLHDDTELSGDDLAGMVAAHHDTGAVVVPEPPAADEPPALRTSCVVGSRATLLDAVAGTGHFPGVAIGGIPVVAVPAQVRHEGRCLRQLADPTGPDGRPLLVANLIVRDEETMLGDCLASLEGLVDRIEVVDTGSVDRTVEIAEAAGAIVTHHPWRHSFSEARNHALERSRDAWYVIGIDADERVECREPIHLRKVLASYAGEIEGISVEVRNVAQVGAGAGPSSARGLRIFRAEGTAFEGAIHEVLRDTASGAMLEALDLDVLSVRHLGYTSDAVDRRGKRLRNLELAREQYRHTRSQKAALDYARSLAFAGGDPVEALRLIEEALAGPPLPSASQAYMLGIGANLLAELGDAERAMVMAEEGMTAGDDLAAAVFARSATALGRHRELTEAALSAGRTPRRLVVASDGNRRIFESLAAAARVRLGDTDGGLAEAERILRTGQGFPSWDELIRAVWDQDPAGVVDRLEPLVCLDADGEFAEQAAALMPGAATARLCAAYLDSGGSAEDVLAIGLASAWVAGDLQIVGRLAEHARALGDEVVERLVRRAETRGDRRAAAMLRGDERTGLEGEGHGFRPHPADIAHVIGSRRRAFVPDHDLAALLRAAGCRVTGDEEQAPFEAVVIGEEAIGEVASRLRSLVDPAGIVVGWGRLQPGGRRVCDVLHTAGFETERFDALVIGRPVWDETTIESAAAALEVPDRGGAAVLFVGRPSAETLLALRASVPFSEGLEILAPVEGVDRVPGAVADLDGRRTVLVVPSSVVPAPEWVQALWDAHYRSRGPVGCSVIGPDGLLVHAGCDAKGRPFGAGSGDPRHPLFAADRPDAGLLPPVVARAHHLRSGLPTPGRFVGAAGAVTVDPLPVGDEAAPLREVMPDAVLVIGGGDDEIEEQIVEACREAGLMPVIHPEGPGGSLWRRRMAGRGAVIAGRESPGAHAAALRPVATVYLTERAVAQHRPACAAAHPDSIEVGPVALGDGSAQWPAALRRAIAGARREARDPPGRIAPRETRHGRISIVVPALRDWEAVEASLGRIRASTEEPHDVILVDAGAAGPLPEHLEASGFEVVTAPDACGVAEAINLGIDAADGEYVCLLDEEARPMEGWLAEMLAALRVKGTALVGPRLSVSPGPQILGDAPAFDTLEEALGWCRTWTAGRRGEHWPAPRLDGLCLLGPRELFVQVGGLCGGEDPAGDLCGRVRRTAGELRVADGAVVLRSGAVRPATDPTRTPRWVSDRRSETFAPGLLTVLVLSDGRPGAARTTADSAAPIADRIRVVERRGLSLTELAVSEFAEDVLGIDWHAEGGVAAALEGIGDRHVLVCLAGERVAFDDWGRIRARLEALEPGPIEIAVVGGPEVRIHPADPEVAGCVGGRSGVRLDGLRLAQ